MADSKAGVATRQGTHRRPVGFYARRYGLQPEDFPNSVIADRLTLSLPLFPQLTDDEQETVVPELRGAFEQL